MFRAAVMSPEAHKASMKELHRLKKMPQQMPEHAMIRLHLISHAINDYNESFFRDLNNMCGGVRCMGCTFQIHLS